MVCDTADNHALHKVYLGLGSNIDPEVFLLEGGSRLRDVLAEIEVSSIYYSEAVGFEGPPFLNVVVAGMTGLSLSALAVCLRTIEVEFGRHTPQKKLASRKLDIDILLYDDLCGSFDRVYLPRPEILENSYVLIPLVELSPTLIHPQEDKPVSVILKSRVDIQKQANDIGLRVVAF
jgi:2-amino-4-hydroxy-6-hydroxymethyldihydropteridine diphosphokinase